MKIYNKHGSQYFAYNVNDLVSLELQEFRFGTNGKAYLLDNATGYYYPLVIKTIDGILSLDIDETSPTLTVP